MESSTVPPALRERLGGEGTAGLLGLLETTCRNWRAEVVTACLERFERRLVQEVAGLRVEMAEGHATLRTQIASLHEEIGQTEGKLRVELAQTEGRLRAEMHVGFGIVREELANNRVEFLRWSFLFWVGQFFAVAGLVGVLMRGTLAR